MKERISLKKKNNNNNNKRTIRAKSEEFGSVGSNGVADGLIIGKLSAKLNTSSIRIFYDTSDTENFLQLDMFRIHIGNEAIWSYIMFSAYDRIVLMFFSFLVQCL